MKKDRNAFFNEANFSQSSYLGTPNMPNMNGNFGGPMPTYGTTQTSGSFYSGPAPIGMNAPMMNNDYASDMESRLAKIERQINRLDARINRLEASGITATEKFDNTTNMYML